MLKEIVLISSLLIDKGGAMTTSPSPDLSPAPRSTAAQELITSEEIILIEAKRLGIEESDYEKGLWDLNPFRDELGEEEWDNLDVDTKSQISTDEVIFVLENMSLSENQYFNKTYENLSTLAEKNMISFEPVNDPNVGIAANYQVNEQGELLMSMIYNPDIVLSSKPIDMAYAIARLAANGTGLVKVLEGKLTPEEQLAEAIAFEANSFIEEAGLHGEIIGELELENSPVIFIENGSDSKNPAWIEYVVEEFGFYPEAQEPEI